MRSFQLTTNKDYVKLSNIKFKKEKEWFYTFIGLK